jgi:hypothetical protein
MVNSKGIEDHNIVPNILICTVNVPKKLRSPNWAPAQWPRWILLTCMVSTNMVGSLTTTNNAFKEKFKKFTGVKPTRSCSGGWVFKQINRRKFKRRNLIQLSYLLFFLFSLLFSLFSPITYYPIPCFYLFSSFNGYNDELVWAALWLYKATGESRYLDYAQVTTSYNGRR